MLTTRAARPEEYDQVAARLEAAYSQYAAPAPSQQHWERYLRDLVDVRSRLADSALLVAEADGRLLGTVTYYPPYPPPSENGQYWPVAWAGIRLLGVHPNARGRRWGHLLTEHCIERARAARGGHRLAHHRADGGCPRHVRADGFCAQPGIRPNCSAAARCYGVCGVCIEASSGLTREQAGSSWR